MAGRFIGALQGVARLAGRVGRYKKRWSRNCNVFEKRKWEERRCCHFPPICLV